MELINKMFKVLHAYAKPWLCRSMFKNGWYVWRDWVPGGGDHGDPGMMFMVILL